MNADETQENSSINSKARSKIAGIKHRLKEEEIQLIYKLRQERQNRKRPDAPARNFGARIADTIATSMGSWTFIIVQSGILLAWIILNVTAYIQRWDPYPFILLNLMLSFQSAYAAPLIMMSQNRQTAHDRESAEHDYDINIKAELEIELLHEKIDILREQEIVQLLNVIKCLEEKIVHIAGPH